MKIKILATGGTIDKKYNFHANSMGFENSYVPEMLKQSKCSIKVTVETVFMKSGEEITEQDREIIYRKCIQSTESRIIITHGNYSISKTALFLAKKIENKTIVLLCSSIPYSHVYSDALFNLGCSITAVQNMPKNIYILKSGNLEAVIKPV